VADERLRAAYERLEAEAAGADVREVAGARIVLGRRSAAGLAAAAAAPRQPAPLPAAGGWTAVKVEVSRAGRVRVPVADLYPWGFPGGPIDPTVVRLTNFGRPVRYTVETGGTGQPEALTFAADELSTDYTGRNAYVLSWGAIVPTTGVALTRSSLPPARGMVRVERNQYYAAYLPRDADPWIWDLMVAGQPAGPWSFDLPGLRPRLWGPVAVRVRVVGGSETAHSVTAFINGVSAGHLEFAGVRTALLTGEVPFEVLRPTGNVLTLQYESPAADPAVLYLDCLDVGVALSRDGAVTPDRIAGFDPTLPSLDGVDYLIVTHALFRPQAQAIAALKQAEGLSAAVVDVERAYDRFSGGVVEPNAVRALVASRPLRPRPGYVLLVGDDTYDPRDYTGTGGVSYIPSLMGWDGQFGRVPSENRYADVNGDRRPDFAIGRLPVSSTAQADVMVQKIADQATRLGGQPVMAVDNPGPDDVSFRTEAAAVAAWLPEAPAWADIESQGIDQARQTLLGALLAGAATASYFGHGGHAAWADEHLLSTDDLPALEGTGALSVVLAWTCNAQWYQNHLSPSLGEGLVLVPQGGAAAAVGPAGMTAPVLEAALYSRLYPALAGELTLGEAMRRAKAETLRADPAAIEAVEGFNLLGDPALRLPGYTVRRNGMR
jgi:hypothetical protein